MADLERIEMLAWGMYDIPDAILEHFEAKGIDCKSQEALEFKLEYYQKYIPYFAGAIIEAAGGLDDEVQD